MTRRAALVIALSLLSVPPLLALADAARYRAANRSNGMLVSSGIEREYLLHVPSTYTGTTPVPLVISMHGAGGWPAMQRDISKWNELADREGFIVVYPSGRTGRGPRVFIMDIGTAPTIDVRYVADLIDHLAGAYNIDRRRVYANGLSNGGGMTFVLSCTLSDRIAAVGLVASALLTPSSACRDPRPVPVIAFHGTADDTAPYYGGHTWVAPRGSAFLSVPRFVADWARRNQCHIEPIDTRIASDTMRRSYDACAGDAVVQLYTIEGGGHTWPGGGPLPEWFMGATTQSIDATRLMWEFFQQHPLR